MSQRVGLYPGTFDPITNGHLDIIGRSSKLVDRLVIGVGVNTGKKPAFSLEERVAMVEREVGNIQTHSDIDVVPFEGLLVKVADQLGAGIVIRGLRGVTDFEYEVQMVGMNTKMNPDVETVFLTASAETQFIASKLVREIAMMGGDIAPFVPPKVAEETVERLNGTL